MDERLNRLWALYGEDATSDPSDQSSDPAMDDEEIGWQELKAMLDARPRRSPGHEALEAVRLAARGTAASSRAADRSAVARGRAGIRRLAVSGVVTAMLVGILLVFRPVATDPPLTPSFDNGQVSEARNEPPAESTEIVATEDAIAEPALVTAIERNGDETPADRVRPAVSPATTVNVPEDEEEGDGLFLVEEDLDWDQSDEVREIYDHLEELYLVSPQGSYWRNASRPEALTAPVGLVRTQQTAAYPGP